MKICKKRDLIITMLLICCIWALNGQSPYALIGSDLQVSGPVDWSKNASHSEKMSSILAAWAMEDEFSGSVIIATAGEVKYQGAFGWADRSFNTRNSTNTKYRIGYMVLHLAQFALLQIAMEGKINLNDTVNKHLVVFTAEHFADMTIKDLLTFHSGINENLEDLIDLKKANSLNQLIATINKEPQVHRPGQVYAFGWSSIVILAKLVESKSQKTFNQYVQENIFDTFGMRNSGFADDTTLVKNLARPYVSIFGEYHNPEETNTSSLGPLGTIYSTVEDLYQFYSGISEFYEQNDGPVKDFMDISTYAIKGKELTINLKELPLSRTFDLLDMNGWHNGYSGLLTFLIDKKNMIIVLSNTFRATEIYDIRRRFVRGLFDLPIALPLPKTEKKLWEKLDKDGSESASKFYIDMQKKGVASLPLRDEFMFLCREMRKQGNLDKALEVSKLLVAIDQGWVSYRELGETYRLRGETKKAKENFIMALALNPDNPKWQANMENYISRN